MTNPKSAIAALLFLGLQWGGSMAVAESKGGGCGDRLESEITAIQRRYAPSGRERWGILAATVNPSPTLYRQNDRQYFIPASNTKLLTTAAALHRLGGSFRIRTSVYRTADGVRIVGRGDPSIGREQLDLLAAQIAEAGIRQIDRLVAEDAYFRGSPYNPHWQWEDVQSGYGTPVNSLIFDLNSIPFTLFPQAVGQPLRLEWDDPQEDKIWRVENQTITVAEGEPEFIEVGRDFTQPILYLRGQLIAGSPSEATAVAVTEPGRRFVDQFQQALAAAGVTVERTEVTAEPSSEAGEEIAAIESPPLSELVQEVNQNSNNLYAEALLRSLGVFQDPANGDSAAAGIAAVKKSLSELGVDPSSYLLDDGSGLSRLNAISPEALVQTLQAAIRSPFAAIYRESLPLAGETGTLGNRFVDSPLQGNVRAKTGTLAGVSALSGYLYPDGENPLSFSIIVEAIDLSVTNQRQAIDEIVGAIDRCYSRDGRGK
ncbi:MAG TPA: D-alanyl-D-alanine carboxypeptidase/D-alanyl-D-alanine-endopeptidase [Oscillatoriales cyanobacterium M59_W2019_021]|nr:D-alanyl-D-alanine carboxypeptidase/D-alanyl-D-alanine-endopeptidase [Oscillatoriales cyanobacterium M4454_W2019_049]HIK51770.1 D-alanyl-D-alanine carboxypeptidase/D-alanyl-D-alanine-endopeptidase [Oscillatoriales cyanobacterium M59_W2019_021]